MPNDLNFTTFHLLPGGDPLRLTLDPAPASVTVIAVEGIVGVAQFGPGGWNPKPVGDMIGNDQWMGAALPAGERISFTLRAVQAPDGAGLFLASMNTSQQGPSIASVFVFPAC